MRVPLHYLICLGLMSVVSVLPQVEVTSAEPFNRLEAARLLKQASEIWSTDKNKAAELEDRAIQLDPDNGEAYKSRAYRYMSKKDYPKAVADFNEAIRLTGEKDSHLSRESLVPAHELEGWQRAFLEAGSRGLKRQSDSEERELLRTRAKLGERMMRLELAEGLIEKKGYGAEWKKHTP